MKDNIRNDIDVVGSKQGIFDKAELLGLGLGVTNPDDCFIVDSIGGVQVTEVIKKMVGLVIVIAKLADGRLVSIQSAEDEDTLTVSYLP